MNFPADGTVLNFFFLANVVWHHSVYCQLDLGSKWCTQLGYSKVFACSSSSYKALQPV
jgi:predicted solute-binding protein